MRHDLDAAHAERFVQPLEFGDRQLRHLQRYSAKAGEAIRMAPDNIGDLVVDRARGRLPEVRVRAVIGLPRRRRDRLDVNTHQVHISDALLSRCPLHTRPHSVLTVDVLAARVRLRFQKPTRHGLVALDHGGGLDAGHVAVNVDGEPLAAGMHGTRETSGDSCPLRQAGEQHPRTPLIYWVSSPVSSCGMLSIG
jgi:hypothetical protein